MSTHLNIGRICQPVGVNTSEYGLYSDFGVFFYLCYKLSHFYLEKHMQITIPSDRAKSDRIDGGE